MTIANDPQLKSWISVTQNSDFPIQNIPFGIFKTTSTAPRVATRIGDQVIDICALKEFGYLNDFSFSNSDLENQYLNDFIAHGKSVTSKLRNHVAGLFAVSNPTIKNNADHLSKIVYDLDKVQLLMPVQIGDYTDFYSSREHATNVGIMFRDPENALLPNWLHLPVGYHGRSSSIVVSGDPIRRPKGQQKADTADKPSYGPSKLLDFELEMGFIIGKNSKMGDSVSTGEGEDHIFGMVLFNDWSARDIQKWEYVPLGPFLGKSFASSISPWIVTLDALDPFRIQGPKQEPEVLPYLQYEGKKNFDINLEVAIAPEGQNGHTVSKSNFQYMYWNMVQQLAHHTVNGCNIRIGDMMASGTISGPTVDSYGSMLEISWRGSKPVKMPDGTERKFINDGDTVIMKGYCEKEGYPRVGFGTVEGKVLPAL